MKISPIIHQFTTADYESTWKSMQEFTDQRDTHTPDEIWLLQHFPVFTQGQAGKPEHILNPHKIPVVQTDRGGQVTYHGPGQLIAYVLCDLKRLRKETRSFVMSLERVVIHFLQSYGISANARRDAPGVYVNDEKICSIGLRVRRGCSYHGIALNVSMDLTPFSYINPCGFENMKMTQLSHFSPSITIEEVMEKISPYFTEELRYTTKNFAR